MELNWDIFMKSVAETMGWTSEAALKSAFHCSDNHKAWQLLLTFHIGSMCELVQPYVTHCMISSMKPSAEGFISFVKDKESNDIFFLCLFEVVCKYSQGIVKE